MSFIYKNINLALIFRGKIIPIYYAKIEYFLLHERSSELPYAEVYVPVGTMFPDFVPSPSKDLTFVRHQEYASVVLTQKTVSFGDFDPNSFSGIVTLFIGVITSITPSVIYGSAAIRVTINHWISVLEYTSLLGSELSPQGITDFGFESNLTLCGFLDPGVPIFGDKEAKFAEIVATSQLNFFQNPELWSLLYNIYTILLSCNVHTFSVAALAGVADPTLMIPKLKQLNNAFTSDVFLALNSILGFLFLNFTDPTLFYGVFHDLLASENSPFYFKDLLNSDNHSVLSHLKYLATRYFFFIVPLVNYTILIPNNIGIFSIYNPLAAYGKTYTINVDEISSILYQKQNPRTLRGVITLVKSKYAGLHLQKKEDGANDVFFGGGFFGLPVGLLKFVNAPSYINISAEALAGAAAGDFGDFGKKFVELGKKWLGGARNVEELLNKFNDQLYLSISRQNLLEKFSHFIYVYSLIGERFWQIVCPGVRLDISPGSNISVSSFEGHPPLFGTVRSVKYEISGVPKNPKCETVYEMLGVRDIFEFVSPTYSVPSHFIYKFTVSGSPMIISV